MSEGINISNLSYKELQALALRYRVPGNIKKQLLIEVLQAARCGNEQEVDKLLADLRQNRKKRIRKAKPNKLTMSLASTPIHSPTYDMADDYYAAQHRLPYQWVGAEEEIPNRQLDDANRVPQYEEFRQFLLRRIQRDYQTYNTNHNDKVDPVDPGGIMDLRNDQGESIRFETDTAVRMRSNNVVAVSGLETVQSYAEQIAPNQATPFDYQILEDPNGNGNASILLRRMLQAPVGANLGEIASPELGPSCKIWGNEQYQSQSNFLDNSDTLSANSDVNGNDVANWPICTEYYRFVNNVRDQLILNSASVPGNRSNFEQPAVAGQFCGILTEDNPAQYQLLYANQIPDVPQQQGQGWETTAGPFDNDVLNYQRPKKIFPSSYYDGISPGNYAATRLVETDPLQQQYVTESPGNQVDFTENRNKFEGNSGLASALSRSDVKFYQNLNNDTEPDAHSGEIYSSLKDSANFPFVRPNTLRPISYYASGEALHQTTAFVPPMQHLGLSNSHQPFPPGHNGHAENAGCSTGSAQTSQPPQLIEEFNRPGIFGQYHPIHKGDALGEEDQNLYQPVDRDGIRRVEEVEGETEKTIFGSTPNTQSDCTTSLDAFWPRRSTGKNTTDNCLENILNLNAYGYVDYSKIDQTSCIYCYSAPIVTQGLFDPNSTCSQKKRFVAEFRQHTFSPYWLLYNDANTGMQMSRHVEGPRDKIIETVTSAGNEIDRHSVNRENNQTRDSEFWLEKEPPKSGTAEMTREISSFDSSVQVQYVKSGSASTADSNNQEETQSSIDLNMENVSC